MTAFEIRTAPESLLRCKRSKPAGRGNAPIRQKVAASNKGTIGPHR